MTRIVEHMNRNGYAAFVQQTGGGVATVYAGRAFTDPNDPSYGDRYELVAGPGWFTEDFQAFTDLSEFIYSKDDDGEGPYHYVTAADGDEEAIAAIFVAYIVRNRVSQ